MVFERLSKAFQPIVFTGVFVPTFNNVYEKPIDGGFSETGLIMKDTFAMFRWRLIPNSARDGIRAQLTVFAICVGLIIANESSESNAARLFPLIIVAINAIVCLGFWIVRLNTLRGSVLRSQVALAGFLAMGIGYVGLLSLIAALGILIVKPIGFQNFYLSVDPLFYILCGWAVLELIHHHVYKLIYGKHDTLEYIIRSGHWQSIKAPLGGAIGVQVRKIRQ